MRSIALALFCLLASMPAFALDPKPASPVATVRDEQLSFKPSRVELIEAYYASGLLRATGSVLVAYDEKGNVLGVKLEKSTGSSSLDKAIMAWAAQVRVRAASSGISSIPFEFAPY